MAKQTSRCPELEEVVVTALADYLDKNDELFNFITIGERETAKGIIRATSILDETPERTRIMASNKPILVGYGYDIKDYTRKIKYEIALQIAKRKNGSEQFVAEGIEDNCGWYITKIE